MKKVVVASIAKLDNTVIKTFKDQFHCPIHEVYCYDNPTKMSSLKLHWNCIIIAFKILTTKNKYDYIIFWQQFIGIYFGFLSRFTIKSDHKTKSLILTFIFLKRASLLGKIHHRFVAYSINSISISKIICHSRPEVHLYKNLFPSTSNKFSFCLLGEGNSSELNINEAGYYFSGGSSNRDYSTLIKAFSHLENNLIIACKPNNVERMDIPDNVKVSFDAYGHDFISLIRLSKATIILVSDTKVSSGQLVILHSMRYGKPLIVTKSESIKDYIDPSYAIQVEPNSLNDIRQAIVKLEKNPDLLISMSKNAFDNYNKFFSFEKYATRICNILSND